MLENRSMLFAPLRSRFFLGTAELNLSYGDTFLNDGIFELRLIFKVVKHFVVLEKLQPEMIVLYARLGLTTLCNQIEDWMKKTSKDTQLDSHAKDLVRSSWRSIGVSGISSRTEKLRIVCPPAV